MEIPDLIQRLAKAKPVFPILAEVIEVNDDKTVDVRPLSDEPEFYEVRINADIQASSGVRIVPRKGSKVFILPVNRETAIVVMTSEAEKILIDCDNVIFNGGESSPLVVWNSLKAELDKTKEVVEALVKSLTEFTPGSSDGGAALKVYANAQLAGKTVGNYDGLEDNKIKH